MFILIVKDKNKTRININIFKQYFQRLLGTCLLHTNQCAYLTQFDHYAQFLEISDRRASRLVPSLFSTYTFFVYIVRGAGRNS